MNFISFSLVLIGVLLNAMAQLLLKAGTNSIGVISYVPGQLAKLLLGVALEPHIIGGLACYVISVGVWIVALSRVEVSVAYPMLSIGYVVNAVAARFLFGEVISLTRIVGIAVIIVGVILVSRS